MPAFAAKYSTEQRETLYRECIDEARPVAQVLRDAQAGTLDGLDPVQQAQLGAMPYGYAARLVKDEGHARRGVKRSGKEPIPGARDLIARLLARTEREVIRLERIPSKPLDIATATATARLIGEIVKVARDIDAVPKAGKAAPAAAPAPQGIAARIAAAAQKPEPAELPTTPTDASAQRATGSSDTVSSQNRASSGAVRLRAASPADPADARLSGARRPV